MAKGRRHGAPEERLLAAPAHSGGGDGSGDDEADLADLAEDDVWRCLHAAADGDRDPGRGGRRWAERRAGGLFLAFDDTRRPGPVAAASQQKHRAAVAGSAPVDVPSWPRSLVCEEAEAAEREWVPPHEYLARARAQGKSVATSVLEGAGRTLKGRDVSRVRDAVWRQTGFSG